VGAGMASHIVKMQGLAIGNNTKPRLISQFGLVRPRAVRVLSVNRFPLSRLSQRRNAEVAPESDSEITWLSARSVYVRQIVHLPEPARKRACGDLHLPLLEHLFGEIHER